MEDNTIYCTTAISLICIFLALKFHLSRSTSHKNKNKLLPPSPPSIPILGHLHLLKPPMHRDILYKFAQKYGPIFSLWFGPRRVVVLSSLSLVEECFTKNDIVFANRPKLLMAKHFNYNSTTVTQASYGDHWRNLRRICTIEVFSNHRLNSFLSIRKDEIRRLLVKLSSDTRDDFAKVELKSMFAELTFNIIMRMVSGKRYYGDNVDNEEEARNFREIMREATMNGGVSYPGDFFPMLKWIDWGDYEKRVKRLAGKTDAFLQGLVDEHRRKREGSESVNSMIDHLLSLQESQPEYYTDQIIKGLVLVMLLAGTETSAVTLEWIMSHLVNHPEILHKARAEMDSQLGQENLIDEPDVSKAHYIQAIIYETLRLNPTAPLLVPHISSDDCTLGGYYVPRDTILMVNAWVVHRDSELWDEPSNFKPERFLNGDTESAKLIPFGIGRRACPGSGLAQRVIGLTLGSLIQCFEWKRVSEKLVDMSEGKGVTVPRVEPLEVMCKARPIMNKLFL
ncbi:cytochrome P450 81E8-like [Tripterygium wilfordii]|uniref:cytochrome P450 81E8-like n=1 Tax=Tripterygium wilfordii TaxID=458696 RepID=UPI0018F81661|nr:cytochrome P450 81E8-like [Tripterygium wilfordii]